MQNSRVLILSSVYFIFCTFLIAFNMDHALAKEPSLPELVVTSPRFSIPLTEASQHIDVIEAEEIRGAIGVRTIDEVLRHISGVDVQQRGAFGIQSDVSLRGAGFEQTLFLLNGMRINDPQTGHFHSDVPVNLEDIERIEVMPGGASALYGHGGFGGVVNIITKGKLQPGLKGGIILGSHNYQNWTALLASPVYKDIQLRLSLNDQRSDGYRPNTDFHTSIYNVQLNTNKWQFFGGYSEKRFGANGFYTLRFPMQWEHTKTALISAKANLKLTEIAFDPGFIYRHHYDYYVLDRNNHRFYQNTHRTNSLSLRLPIRFEVGDTRYMAGGELSYDNIDSTRLGEHNRNSKALFAGISSSIGKARVDLDLRFDHYSGGIGFEHSPSLGIAYKINESLKLRASGNRSFRLPSYTELYYKSPTSIGNPDLKPERAWQVEGGIDYYGKTLISGLTVFRRWGTDIIDWFNRGSIWQAENIRTVDTNGLTVFSNLYLGRHVLRFDYTYLDQSSDAGTQAYYMNYLRHKANMLLTLNLPDDTKGSLNISHQKRITQSAYTLVDIKLSKHVKVEKLKLKVFVEGRNLFDTTYQDFSGLPMPGRWLFGGIEVGI